MCHRVRTMRFLSLALISLLAGCEDAESSSPTTDATAEVAPLDTAVSTDTAVSEAAVDSALADAPKDDATPGEGGLGDGSSDGAGTGCPSSMPNLGVPCSFTGICSYPDPNAPTTALCNFKLACAGGSVARGDFSAFAVACPTELPTNDTLCTCGFHLFGEASGGVCNFSCGGGSITARCKETGGLGASGEKWSVSACEAPDAATDGS